MEYILNVDMPIIGKIGERMPISEEDVESILELVLGSLALIIKKQKEISLLKGDYEYAEDEFIRIVRENRTFITDGDENPIMEDVVNRIRTNLGI